MITIWYLLHCPKQDEWKIADTCKQNLSEDALKDAFVFTFDKMRKFHGKWHLERALMFPSYVFLESNDEAALMEELGKYGIAACLINEFGMPFHVNKSDEMFLKLLCKDTHHLAMSKGVIRNGITHITEGPLRGMEERICRIDRHKRLARLLSLENSISDGILERIKVSESFSLGNILAGLEIVEKT